MIRRLSQFWQSRPPAVRLTLAYMLILLVISAIFSLTLYRLASAQLESSLLRQYSRFRPSFGSDFGAPPDPTQIEEELVSGRRELAIQLLYFDLVILVLGSGASYWLAKQTVRPIEEALESQSQFTADASHELRTPLTAMQTEIEVALRKKGLTKAQAKSLLASNLEEVAKLRALSDGLLKLARNDGSTLAREVVSLEDVAVEVLNRVIVIAQEKGITIENKIGPTKVLGDAQTLAELFVILLDNAIKYSPPKSAITMQARRHGNYAHISIADQGKGIKGSELEHIFKRFYRGDQSRSKNNVDGYGLGLSIAQKIAELHNGKIRVTSSLGKGSTFTVTLPVDKS